MISSSSLALSRSNLRCAPASIQVAYAVGSSGSSSRRAMRSVSLLWLKSGTGTPKKSSRYKRCIVDYRSVVTADSALRDYYIDEGRAAEVPRFVEGVAQILRVLHDMIFPIAGTRAACSP